MKYCYILLGVEDGAVCGAYGSAHRAVTDLLAHYDLDLDPAAIERHLHTTDRARIESTIIQKEILY